MTAKRIAIHGAAGRMGQRLIALAAADAQLRIVAALEAPGHFRLGQDAGAVAGIGPLGVPLSPELPEGVDTVIDFSVPAGTEAIVGACVAKGVPLVVATTGLDQRQKDVVRSAAHSIALLWSPSMSLAVNLAMRLSAVAAAALARQAEGVDVEIIERHHRFKEDAPSGTALKFGEIIAGQMGQTRQSHGRLGRPGERPRNEIGYHAIRVGDNPGEHTIVFGMLGETLEVVVKASSRDCYAHGALAAAKFLAGKPPGLYGIENVLGLA
jgi:4-hydroxy-tetrahydrodipicolinate reductase